jgi:2,3-bisphosphoglycerate-independent phosphoglycerate mutase
MKNETSEKFILLVGDGMADYPLAELAGKTPLEVAHTPNMDRIAACRIGFVNTIPQGIDPGSDVANLSLLGYDPSVYRTGRGPFEAASMGVNLGENQVAFRMNLVTLDRRSEQEMIMVSNSSGEITTEESRPIIAILQKELSSPGIDIYQGIAYRHLLVWEKGPVDARTIPPHDVQDQNMAAYLDPARKDPIVDVMRNSWKWMEDHPVNLERKRRGLHPANSVWLWGQGKALNLPLFNDKFGLQGGVISAVDLLRGIGFYAGLKSIEVEGATGYLDTNFLGKAEEALEAMKHLDFMFVHVEAPDEASHSGNIEEKIEAIEAFDKKVVGTVLEGMVQFDNYRIMVVSDHYTPISKKTHTSEPPPFAWASNNELDSGCEGPGFSEESAARSELIFQKGHNLMESFLNLP